MKEVERINWITNLRVIAAVSVITIHVSVSVTTNYTANFLWHIGNLYESMSRFCIPVFLMITGALLLPQNIELKAFLQKRFSRILLPFFFWSIVYILLEFYTYPAKEEDLTVFGFVRMVILKLLYGAEFHLWYIYILISLYLFIPILGKWIRNSNEKEIIYFIIIWFISLLIGKRGYFSNLNLQYFAQYIGYLVLGYYLSVKKFQLTIKTMRILSSLLFLLGFLITALGTYFLAIKYGKQVEDFYDYLTPNVLISSIGVFLFVKSFEKTKKRASGIIVRFIDKYSYGIYLVHVLGMIILDKIGVDAFFIHPIIGIPITVFLCLGISSVIVFIINKLPAGKYISG
jgi:surface polysaccharide O-acyltransferase-like enzyme